MADNLVLIHDGQIQISGRPESMASQEETLARSFFGEQFTFELLEKYTLDRYPSVLHKNRIDYMNDEVSALTHRATFREVITEMLEKGVTEVGVHLEDGMASVGFGDLVKMFGGAGID